MDQRQLENLLRMHAQQLEPGLDSGTGPADVGLEEQGALDDLLQLARRLTATLRPLQPRPGFTSHLRAQVLGGHALAVVQRESERRLLWAVGLGGLFYLVSLALLSLRAAAFGKSLFSGIMMAWAAWKALPADRSQVRLGGAR